MSRRNLASWQRHVSTREWFWGPEGLLSGAWWWSMRGCCMGVSNQTFQPQSGVLLQRWRKAPSTLQWTFLGWRSPKDVVVEGVRQLRPPRFANTASQCRSFAPPALQGDGGALVSLLSCYLLVSSHFSCKNSPELCFTGCGYGSREDPPHAGNALAAPAILALTCCRHFRVTVHLVIACWDSLSGRNLLGLFNSPTGASHPTCLSQPCAGSVQEPQELRGGSAWDRSLVVFSQAPSRGV